MSELNKWKVIRNNWANTSIVNSYGNTIAKLSIPDEEDDENYNVMMSELESNARLIAASPDMLTALMPVKQEILNRHNYPDLMDENGSLNEDFHMEFTITVKEVRAILNAIASAEGKKQQ